MIQKIENDIRQFLKENADEANVKKYSRYFKEGYDPYGVDGEKLHQKIDEWFNTCQKELSQKELLTLCDHLMGTGKYEEASIAITFMVKLRSQYNKSLFNAVGKWFEKYITNWAHSDVASHAILYPFLTDKVIEFKDLLVWADSPHRWKRRAAAVTLIKDFSKSGSVPQALQVARKLILDQEKVVQQGTGWLLREAWKKSPEKVEDFLLKWKDQAPRLIIQYATEKIDKEKRKKFRRSE
ncbi:MAG: DNA alkylation repair protein [Candidatus Zixiibacteriota bacterium]